MNTTIFHGPRNVFASVALGVVSTLTLGVNLAHADSLECAVLIGCFTEASAGWRDMNSNDEQAWVCKDGNCMTYDGPVLDILATGGSWDQVGWDTNKIPDVAWNDLTNGGTWVCALGECSYFNGSTFGPYQDILQPGGYWQSIGWDVTKTPTAAWNDLGLGGVWVCADQYCSYFDGSTFGAYVDILTPGGAWDLAGWDLSLGAPTSAWVLNDDGDVKVCAESFCAEFDAQTGSFDVAWPTPYTACPEGMLSTCEDGAPNDCDQQGAEDDEVCWHASGNSCMDSGEGRVNLGAADMSSNLISCAPFHQKRCERAPNNEAVRTVDVEFWPLIGGVKGYHYGPWVTEGCTAVGGFDCCMED